MPTEQLTYVTEEMRKAQGQWGPERVSFPITETDIRRWAMATYHPHKPPRIYWDSNYAATTRWKGIVATPDFNPFAWSLDSGAKPGKQANVPQAQPRHPSGRRLIGMNGGQTDTYGVAMRPGDVIISRSRLLDWKERAGRLGHTLYLRTEIEWKNQQDQIVRTRISTSIRY